MDSRIIIFTRYPIPGKTKTRLIPVLGAEGAAALHRCMTEHTVRVVRNLAQALDFSIEVRFSEGNIGLMSQWLGEDHIFREQSGSDVGDRMWRAFREAFEDNFRRVVIVGCDCPGIHETILETSLDLLKEKDLVLGPANDGGYYLVGMRKPHRELFVDVSWGSDRVLAQTLVIAREQGLSVSLVSALDDIDRPEDLNKLNAEEWIA